MEDVRWEGDGDVVLHADKLGHASSREDGQERWTELTIWRTANGYLVLGVGRSSLPREIDLHWINAAPNARSLVRSLMKRDAKGVRYLTIVAEDALTEAAQHDDAIADELDAALSWTR